MYNFDVWFQFLLGQCTEMEQEVMYASRDMLLDNWEAIIETEEDVYL